MRDPTRRALRPINADRAIPRQVGSQTDIGAYESSTVDTTAPTAVIDPNSVVVTSTSATLHGDL